MSSVKPSNFIDYSLFLMCAALKRCLPVILGLMMGVSSFIVGAEEQEECTGQL